MIIVCASLMNLVAAVNPWSSTVQFHEYIITMMFCGIYGADAFLMFSGFLAFYNINKVY